MMKLQFIKTSEVFRMLLPRRPLWFREQMLLWRRKHLLKVAQQAEHCLSHAMMLYSTERLEALKRLDNVHAELVHIADQRKDPK